MNTITDPSAVAPVDMRQPAFRDDPHPLLRGLRENHRVARDMLGVWLVLHHEDVNAVLRSSQLSREIWRSPGYGQIRPFLADSTMERTTHQWMVFNDPPKHTRLRHPAELQRLRASLGLGLGHQPALMHTAVEEMLRYEGSVTMLARHTVQPYTIGNVEVPAGQVLYCMLGAAHRDPAAFADPDRFDIGRPPKGHLAFGAGIHYCLGAPLARLEAEVAFTRLLQRYPALELADATPRWRKLINLRGLEALPLKSSVVSPAR